jgi:hypothetical protein
MCSESGRAYEAGMKTPEEGFVLGGEAIESIVAAAAGTQGVLATRVCTCVNRGGRVRDVPTDRR